MLRFLRGYPLPRFTSKGISSLLSLLASSLLVPLVSFTLIPLIYAFRVKYNLIEVARKVILL
jgi:ABC-type glycerol-3-phosphate transport system permease component